MKIIIFVTFVAACFSVVWILTDTLDHDARLMFLGAMFGVMASFPAGFLMGFASVAHRTQPEKPQQTKQLQQPVYYVVDESPHTDRLRALEDRIKLVKG